MPGTPGTIGGVIVPPMANGALASVVMEGVTEAPVVTAVALKVPAPGRRTSVPPVPGRTVQRSERVVALPPGMISGELSVSELEDARVPLTLPLLSETPFESKI